jgi:periplasmic protein TonB
VGRWQSRICGPTTTATAWARQISAYFELHKRYPKVQKNKPAKVRVGLVLNRLGQVVSVGVQESSGDPVYDEAALSMIRRSDPVPRPPAALTDEQFSYSLDVNFKGDK